MTDNKLSAAPGEGEPTDEFAPDPRNVKLLKWSIYIMSALLVIGIIVVAVTIAKRSANLGSGASGFEVLDVAVASGAVVSDIDIVGDRMSVHIARDGQPGEILIFNIRHGRLDGRVRLNPAK